VERGNRLVHCAAVRERVMRRRGQPDHVPQPVALGAIEVRLQLREAERRTGRTRGCCHGLSTGNGRAERLDLGDRVQLPRRYGHGNVDGLGNEG
jgi:hypothetical protein